MKRTKNQTPRDETKKKIVGITKSEFLKILDKASKPLKPEPK
jgi:hypothetical protein